MYVLEWLLTGLGFGLGVGFAYILISWFVLLFLGIKDRIVKRRNKRATNDPLGMNRIIQSAFDKVSSTDPKDAAKNEDQKRQG